MHYVDCSVAELSLFWAAPEVLGPRSDSGSDQIGSASAQGKKRRLHAATAPYTNIFHLELLKSELLLQVFFGSHLHVLSQQQSFPFLLAKRMQPEPP